MRGLCAATLRAAEKASPPAPRSVLLAMTFAERIASLEGMMASLDEAGLELVARDAAELAKNPPTDADQLALALRDLCAPLAFVESAPNAATSGVNVWNCGGSAAISLTGLGALRDKVAELGPPLTTIEARLAIADAVPAYAPVAQASRKRLWDAAGLAVSPPAWLAAPVRTAAIAQVVDAVKRMADEPQSVETTRRLARLTLLSKIAAGLDTQRGAAATRAHAALGKLIAAGPPADPALREGEQRRLEAIARAAELLPSRETMRDEKRVVRQFRPALRTMLELARLSEADLLEVFPETIETQAADSINAPRFIAAVAEHRRRLEDLTAIVDASEAILGAQPPINIPGADLAAREEYKLLGDRLLAFAKDAYDLAQKNEPTGKQDLDRALARVRMLANDARDFAMMPGEANLRDPATGAAWHGVLGDLAGRLAAALQTDRLAWLKGWGSPDKPPTEIGSRLRRMHRLMLIVGDAAALDRGGANAWPGWEMTPATMTTLSAGLKEAITGACEANLNRTADADGLMKTLIDRYAEVLIAGRLSRTQDACGGVGWELIAGPAPAVVAFGTRLEDLARICRESHELAVRLARKEEVSMIRGSVTALSRACWDEAPMPPNGPRTR